MNMIDLLKEIYAKNSRMSKISLLRLELLEKLNFLLLLLNFLS